MVKSEAKDLILLRAVADGGVSPINRDQKSGAVPSRYKDCSYVNCLLLKMCMGLCFTQDVIICPLNYAK